MNNITEIILKLPPVLGVSIDAGRKNPMIASFTSVIYNLQMAFFWLKEAKNQLEALTQPISITSAEGQEQEHRLVIPTLLGTPEQLGYMKNQLRELSTGILVFTDEYTLPTEVKYKIDQAYNSIMLGLFNTELSTQYYEQLNTRE